jgi:hypothetical protein
MNPTPIGVLHARTFDVVHIGDRLDLAPSTALILLSNFVSFVGEPFYTICGSFCLLDCSIEQLIKEVARD